MFWDYREQVIWERIKRIVGAPAQSEKRREIEKRPNATQSCVWMTYDSVELTYLPWCRTSSVLQRKSGETRLEIGELTESTDEVA